jgi:hypothetical protein
MGSASRLQCPDGRAFCHVHSHASLRLSLIQVTAVNSVSILPRTADYAPCLLCDRCTVAVAATVASHPRWRAELAELSPSSLVQLLTASDPRLARLQHVAAVGLQEEQSLYYTAAQQTDARFRAKFKQYGRWLLEQKRRGAAGAGGTAAAAAAGSP